MRVHSVANAGAVHMYTIVRQRMRYATDAYGHECPHTGLGLV